VKHLLTCLAAFLMLASHTAAASTTLRCGNGLVSKGSTTAEVLQKCGEPISRDILGSVIRTGNYGESYELLVEEWSYAPRNGMYQFLRFEGGRLVRVDSKRKQ
jgi:hypothetical protein